MTLKGPTILDEVMCNEAQIFNKANNHIIKAHLVGRIDRVRIEVQL